MSDSNGSGIDGLGNVYVLVLFWFGRRCEVLDSGVRGPTEHVDLEERLAHDHDRTQHALCDK